MKYLKWIVLAALSYGLGFLFVQYLSVHPLQLVAYLIAAMIVLFAVILVIYYNFKNWELAGAIVLSIVIFGLGNISMTSIILNRDDPRSVPELIREPGDPGDGHTAVVYFTHGEPETYNPIGWINQFNEFDVQDIPFIPMIARPLFFNALRNSYLEVGTSKLRKMHQRMIEIAL